MNYDDLDYPSFIIKCLVIDKMILANMSSDVGLLVVYTGKGKGKTTAGIRDCFAVSRSWLQGWNDSIYQGRMVLWRT